MGKIIHLDKIREFIEKTPVFRAVDIELLTGNKEYAHLILHKLEKRGEIKRILKGWYSTFSDPTISVFCFKPAYIGLQEALSLHALWEQETSTVIVTIRKVRIGIRNIFGTNVVLHRINKKYFFGFDFMKYENFFIPVSDVEKTLIDLVYFKELPPKYVLTKMSKELNKRKLKEYLKRYPYWVKKKLEKIV
ncbi:MAG: hypothetical protein QXG91_04235 [Candidatus Aenigmatarchaeota archaeon]